MEVIERHPRQYRPRKRLVVNGFLCDERPIERKQSGYLELGYSIEIVNLRDQFCRGRSGGHGHQVHLRLRARGRIPRATSEGEGEGISASAFLDANSSTGSTSRGFITYSRGGRWKEYGGKEGTRIDRAELRESDVIKANGFE